MHVVNCIMHNKIAFNAVRFNENKFQCDYTAKCAQCAHQLSEPRPKKPLCCIRKNRLPFVVHKWRILRHAAYTMQCLAGYLSRLFTAAVKYPWSHPASWFIHFRLFLLAIAFQLLLPLILFCFRLGQFSLHRTVFALLFQQYATS